MNKVIPQQNIFGDVIALDNTNGRVYNFNRAAYIAPPNNLSQEANKALWNSMDNTTRAQFIQTSCRQISIWPLTWALSLTGWSINKDDLLYKNHFVCKIISPSTYLVSEIFDRTVRVARIIAGEADVHMLDLSTILVPTLVAAPKVSNGPVTKPIKPRTFIHRPELMNPIITLQQTQKLVAAAHRLFDTLFAATDDSNSEEMKQMRVDNAFPIARIIDMENYHKQILFLDGFLARILDETLFHRSYIDFFQQYLIARDADNRAKFDESHREKLLDFVSNLSTLSRKPLRLLIIGTIVNLRIFEY